MSCCSDPKMAPLTDQHRVRLRYLGGRTLVVVGPASGVRYLFSGVDREQLVDPRDAVSLAKDRHFRVIGLVDLSAS